MLRHFRSRVSQVVSSTSSREASFVSASVLCDALEPRVMLSNSPPFVEDQFFAIEEDAQTGEIVGVVCALDGPETPSLQFRFGDTSGSPIVLGLTSFDSGLSDGLANQVYSPVGGSDNTLTLFAELVPVATGTLDEVEVITNPAGESFAELTVTFSAAVGMDTNIFDEILSKTGGSGVMTATTSTFNVEGVLIDVGDAALFTAPGVGEFKTGADVNGSADFDLAVIASNLHPTLRYFGIDEPGNAPYQDLNVGGGFVTDVNNMAVTSLSVNYVENLATFAIVGGTGESLFDIDPISGELSVLDPTMFDSASTPSYSLDIQVTDTGIPALSTIASVVVYVDPAGPTAPELLTSLPNTNGAVFAVTPSLPNGNTEGAYSVAKNGLLPVGANWINVQHGDFNGDGLVDVLAQRADLLSWHVGLNTGTSLEFTRWVNEWRTVTDVVVGDFNGDGLDDIAGRRTTIDYWRVGYSDGTQFVGRSFGIDARSGNATIDTIIVGDFDGDRIDDRAVYDYTTRHWYIQRHAEPGWYAWGGFWPSGDQVQTWVPGDYNGDGRLDIAGVRASGRVDAAFSCGFDFTSFGSLSELAAVFPAANYKWFGAGDFDGDGADQLVAQSPNDAFLVAELSPGTMLNPSMPEEWGTQPLFHPSVADVNADGVDDIVGLQGNGHLGIVTMLTAADMFVVAPWVGDFPSLPEKFDGFTTGSAVVPQVSKVPVLPSVMDSLFADDDEFPQLLSSL